MPGGMTSGCSEGGCLSPTGVQSPATWVQTPPPSVYRKVHPLLKLLSGARQKRPLVGFYSGTVVGGGVSTGHTDGASVRS